MSAPIAAKVHKPMEPSTEPPIDVTIVGFVTVGAGQVYGVFIAPDGRLQAAALDRFTDCRVDDVNLKIEATA